MELDADQFAKNMVAKIVIKLGIPIDVASRLFSLSHYIQNYPSASRMVRGHLFQIVNGIKEIKKSGAEYEDIQDHPMVKRHIDKLENFI
jgi:mannose/fructose/N-acetylgalactosamine-specific phosphotransferase system component IIB